MGAGSASSTSFASRVAANGHASLSGLPHLHRWDADVVVSMRVPGNPEPTVCVRMLVWVDPRDRSYEIGIFREGWQHVTAFQGKWRPEETPEQAMRREGAVRLINEVLSASFGIPS